MNEPNATPPTEPSPAPPTPTEPSPAPPTPSDPPAPPPVTTETLDGRETEATADLRRKLEARERELADREIKFAEREARLQRERDAELAAAAAPEKAAWLAGNSLID